MDDNAAYTLVKKLGTGAFGVGNLYRDNETGRNVVIKEFDLSLLEEVNGSAAAADRKRLVLDEVHCRHRQQRNHTASAQLVPPRLGCAAGVTACIGAQCCRDSGGHSHIV